MSLAKTHRLWETFLLHVWGGGGGGEGLHKNVSQILARFKADFRNVMAETTRKLAASTR